jgi:hypothetical protein
MLKQKSRKSAVAPNAQAIKKLQEIEAAKANKQADPKDKDSAKELTAMQARVNQLQTELAAAKQEQTTIKESYEAQLKNEKVTQKRAALLSNYKTIYDELDPDVRAVSINAIIDKALQDSDAELVLDDKNNLTIRRKDGTNLFSEDQVVQTPQKFIDLHLAKSKTLKQADANTDNNSGGQGNNNNNGSGNSGGMPTNVSGNNTKPKNAAASSALFDSSIKELENAPKTSIV